MVFFIEQVHEEEITFSIPMVKDTYVLTDIVAKVLLQSAQNQLRQQIPRSTDSLTPDCIRRTSQLTEEFRQSSTVGQAKQVFISFTFYHV